MLLPAGPPHQVVLLASVRGQIRLEWATSTVFVHLNAHHYALLDGGSKELRVQALGAACELLVITWPAKAFAALLAEAGSPTVVPAASPATEDAIRVASLPIHHLVREIGQCALPAAVQPLWLRAKVLELLALIGASVAETVPAGLSEYDQEQLRFVRDYLTAHVQAPPSLTVLARLAGLNECKLKRGFKALFGLPVFAYLAEYRLREAYLLVEQAGLSATEIAFELGYSSLQHFSAAFRKRFGVAPSTLRPRP